jgi:hypothetical protein
MLWSFKIYYKVTGIKTVPWHENRYIEKWNSTETLQINLYIYSQLIFYKGAKTIPRENLLQLVLGQLDIYM